MSGTTDISKALKELQVFFKRQGWKYCLIGGLAAIRWGHVRFTRDIDLVVLTGIGDEEAYVDQMLSAFQPRSTHPAARQFALENRVLLLKSSTGVPIDVSLGAIGFEEHMLDRATLATIVPGQKFLIASPEDLIVMKSVAGRPQDWQDIDGIIAKQGRSLDWSYIETWLDPLLEILGATERSTQLQSLRHRIESEANRGVKAAKKTRRQPKKKRGKDAE